MELYSASIDDVINSSVSQGRCTYDYALDSFFPLLDRFGEQRKLQNKKFYERLKRDIIAGCVVPPITIAFVDERLSKIDDHSRLQDFLEKNISKGYVLDGMQRLNTLKTASRETNFPGSRHLPFNLIVAERYDSLLYRMITLNNGQKPMSARHQIEMLTNGVINTDGLNITILTEKETEKKSPKGAFKKSDISEAYIAFMSDNLHNQNSRIVEAKLDEILISNIMESDVSSGPVSFRSILELVDALSRNEYCKNWLRLGNNLIGFTLGAKVSYTALSKLNPDDLEGALKISEDVFSQYLETSKVNVGKIRREWSEHFIKHVAKFLDSDKDEMSNAFNLLIMTE